MTAQYSFGLVKKIMRLQAATALSALAKAGL
jgi:hypothetical protein